jgi:hypothetical protein
LIDERPANARGTSWVVDWLAERWSSTGAVVIDGQSPAMSLVPDLTKRKVRVTVTGAAEMARACGMFEDAVIEGSMTHFDQVELNDSLAGARKRSIGQAGSWGWDRRTPTDQIHPIVAVTLAHYGARTTRRKPGRRSRMVVM